MFGAFVMGMMPTLVVAEQLKRHEFVCTEDASAIEHIKAALAILEERARDREARQVEGMHKS